MTTHDGVSNYGDVLAFHDKFGISGPEIPRLLSDEKFFFRDKFMAEELEEFHTSHQHGDLAGAADALVDLVYVAMGTAVLMGLPWQPLWDAVQAANMAKGRAKADGSDSKRGSALDVVKPPGWRAPDIEAVLSKFTDV